MTATHGGTTGRPTPGAAAQPGCLAALAGFAVLLASLINFLGFNDYPLLSGEVLLVVAALALVAVAFGLVAAVGRRIGRAVAEALIIFLAIDLNFDQWTLALVAAAAAGLLAFVRARSILPFVGVMAAVIALLGIVGVGGPRASADAASKPAPVAVADAPVVLHLILDEHIGVAGLPADNRETPALRAFLRDFYLKHGFRTYERAYSSHFNTSAAIPDMLAAPKGFAAGSGYFAAIEKRAPNLKVYQSSFLDLCADERVDACVEYAESGLRSLEAAPIGTVGKATVILNQFASLSEGVKRTEKNYGTVARKLRGVGVDIPRLELEASRRTSTLNALATFDRLIADLRKARPGDAYVAHILLPHYPYVTTADCRIKPVREWMTREDSLPLAVREAAYFEQIRCTTAKLEAALDALAASQGGKRTLVVVHGDHGSRITAVDPSAATVGRFGACDLVAGYSTLLAVRAEGIAPGIDAAPTPVRTRLADLAAAALGPSPPGTAAPPLLPIVLRGGLAGRPVSQALPGWWRGAPARDDTPLIAPDKCAVRPQENRAKAPIKLPN